MLRALQTTLRVLRSFAAALRRLGWLSCTGLLAVVLTACGGGGSSGGSGTLKLALTDAPSCGYDKVHVTVEKIRVHQSSSAGDGDAGWSEILLSPARRVDLLSLTNGVLEELGQTALPAGKYTQMRLVLARNQGSGPTYANSLSLSGGGGAETPLTTPSAQQSGLKMNIHIDVTQNQVADFVLDFNACKSIVKSGNSGNYNLKPVVTVIPRITEVGSVKGYVAMTLAPASTTLSLQLNGVPVRATPPDATTGQFVLAPVPVGTYDLVVTSQGRVTATITGVPVTTMAPTVVNTTSSRIDPPPVPPATATMRTAAGSVSITGASSIDAVVRILKTYAGGPVVEVAAAPVNDATGAFSFALPAEAPVKTVYTASAATLLWTTDPGMPTGQYTVQASAGTVTQQTGIDVSAVNVSSMAFTFP